MKKIIKLTENQLNKIVKRVLSESYEGGAIQQQDKPCDIWCKIKLAKTGSNGDVVKMIQHLLSHAGYNNKYLGGGMEGGCGKEWEKCDGKYRKHIKDAVLEFQGDNDLKPDGVVGHDTLTKMCEVLKVAGSADNSKQILCNKQCNCDDKQSQIDNPPLAGNPGRKRPIIGDEFPPEKSPRDGNWWDVITEPLEDIWDWIITPAPGDGNSEGKNCDKVNGCVKYAMGKDSKNWEFFLGCIGKKIKNPIQKDNPTLKEGCPKGACGKGKPETKMGYRYPAMMTWYSDKWDKGCKSFPVGAAPFTSQKQCEECCPRLSDRSDIYV